MHNENIKQYKFFILIHIQAAYQNIYTINNPKFKVSFLDFNIKVLNI